MKINIIDDSTFIVFHHKTINDKKELETFLNNIFKRIKEKYNINVNGYYDIDIYINEKYGEIIEINKEDLTYYDLFSNKIEMQVNIINDSLFLLEISDILYKDIYLNKSIIKYNNKFYIDINNIEDITLYENGNLIYGKELKKIM